MPTLDGTVKVIEVTDLWTSGGLTRDVDIAAAGFESGDETSIFMVATFTGMSTGANASDTYEVEASYYLLDFDTVRFERDSSVATYQTTSVDVTIYLMKMSNLGPDGVQHIEDTGYSATINIPSPVDATDAFMFVNYAPTDQAYWTVMHGYEIESDGTDVAMFNSAVTPNTAYKVRLQIVDWGDDASVQHVSTTGVTTATTSITIPTATTSDHVLLINSGLEMETAAAAWEPSGVYSVSSLSTTSIGLTANIFSSQCSLYMQVVEFNDGTTLQTGTTTGSDTTSGSITGPTTVVEDTDVPVLGSCGFAGNHHASAGTNGEADRNATEDCSFRLQLDEANDEIDWTRASIGGGGAPEFYWQLITFKQSFTGNQEGFRWRNDDGSETTATWKADQDTTLNPLVKETAARLRYLLNATGDPAEVSVELQYRLQGDPDSEWEAVTL
jgi:hypothetical protein